MKVAFITLYSKHNYGAVLQKYATYQFLKDNCDESILIDYKPKKYKKSDIKSLFKDLLILPRIIKFSKFEKTHFIKRTIKYTFYKELLKSPPQSDIYIVGSDQVWNSKLTWNDDMTKKCLNPAYFLDFVENGIKISYSSSIGNEDILESERSYFKEKLSKFNHISVREESAKTLLENAGISNVKVTLDPVFLLSKKEYYKLVKKIKHNKYLLIYSAEKSCTINTIAKNIAKEKGLQIIELGNYFKNYDSNVFLNNIGIEDFISYFYNADYIVTSSFHGLAFSLIFEKQFIAVKPYERSTRLENLVAKAGLSNRLLVEASTNYNDLINYDIVRNNLFLEIESSKEYLINSIYGKNI